LVFSKAENKIDLSRATWGLIPPWTENEERAQQLWNNTIIARGESMFEKPSFRDSAVHGRCVVPIDGFFDFYHLNGKTFPHYIHREDKKRMLVGGLKSAWTNPATGEIIESFAIITTGANELMSKIHNNPKLGESRMPLLLDENDIDTWFKGTKDEIMELIHPNTTQVLSTQTVRPLRGKQYIGNTPEAIEEFEYAEITGESDQTSLF
jgi:putative SOS response-associated peptidase YedK